MHIRSDSSPAPSRVTKVISFCCFAVILLGIASCNQKSSDDSLDKRSRLDRFLAEEGIDRVPVTAFEFPPWVDASELSSTIVAARLEESIPAGKNVVYCATSLLRQAVGDLAATEQGPSAPADLLPKGSYRFLTGSPDAIRRQDEAGFPPRAGSTEGLSGGELWWCFHFQRSLPFFEAFEPLEEPLVFRSSNGEFDVECFGDRQFAEDSVQQSLRRDQITIIDFRSEDDFVVRLNTQVNEDELILAKVPRRPSLESTLEEVMRRVRSTPFEGSERSEIQEGEALVVPMLTVNLVEWFSDTPLGFQTIRFRLDERGAALDSWLGYECLNDDIVLRQMVFDKPFLLYLKSKSAKSPYFALWVDNLEVLQPFAVAEG